MEISMTQLFKKYRAFDDSPYNVQAQQGLYNKSGKWNIPDSEYPKFLDTIASDLTNNPNIELHYFEKTMPLYNIAKLDLDLLFDNPNANDTTTNDLTTKNYNSTFILKFITEYCLIINKFIIINKPFKIYIQEKRELRLTKDNKLKDGIHILIPDLVINNNILFAIRDELIKSDKIIKLFNSINNKYSLEDTFDKSIIDTVPWLIYGCCKLKDKNNKYVITQIYNIEFINDKPIITLDTNISDSLNSYIYLFSNYNKSHNCTYKEYANSIQPIKTKLSLLEKEQLRLNIPRRQRSDMAAEEIASLLTCLNKSRCDDYTDWWRIGLALFNMDSRNFCLWDNWSKLSIKYDADECYKKWYLEFPKASKYCMGLFTIKDYAKKDNPDLYNKNYNAMKLHYLHAWIVKHIRDNFTKGINIDTFTNHVKQYIEDFANFKTVCADPSGSGIWYKFRRNKWSIDKSANQIYLLLTNALTIDLENLRKELKQKYDEIELQIESEKPAHKTKSGASDSDYDDYEFDNRIKNIDIIDNKDIDKRKEQLENIEKCRGMIKFIKEYITVIANKHKIIEDLSHKCYDEEFLTNINENRDVFVCGNGVLDLIQCIFRQGIPSDMSTISTPIDYPEEPIFNGIELQIQDYLDKIFPDDEIQNYVLNLIAEKLSGHNTKEQFIIFTGSGANGKSQFFKLLQTVFGEYYCSFDNGVLNTPKKDANSASPAIADFKGKRLAFTTEPKSGKPFETDKLKELIGGDQLVGRQLRQDNMRFIPQYLMGIMCNDIPDMPSTDDGVWRKIYVVPFISKFVDKPENFHKINNSDYPNHFKAEQQEHLYKEWAPYFLYMLFERFKKIKANKFIYPIPSQVKDATRKYQMESNIYSQFFNQYIIARPSYSITQTELFTNFKNYSINCNNGQKITKKMFIIQMERFIGKPSKGETYDGFMIKEYNTSDD